MALEHLIFEPEHVDEALDDLYSQFSSQPTIEDLVRALCAGIQEYEDIAYDYAVSLILGVAEGYLLNRLGALVGEKRLGLTDAEYRRVIRAKIAATRSDGTFESIANVIAVYADLQEIAYTTSYPAGYRFYFDPTDSPLSDAELRRLARLLEFARPAGVNGSYVESAVSDSDTFRFDVDPGFGRLLGRLVE